MAGQRDGNAGWVVVGVDGSEHGRRALRWALEEAKLRHLGCLVVHAWHYSSAAANPYLGTPIPEVDAAAHRVLEEEMALTRGSGVSVEGQLVEMGAADALVDASEGAEMLVVGCRGRGALAAAVARLGQHCMYSPRPVSGCCRPDTPVASSDFCHRAGTRSGRRSVGGALGSDIRADSSCDLTPYSAPTGFRLRGRRCPVRTDASDTRSVLGPNWRHD